MLSKMTYPPVTSNILLDKTDNSSSNSDDDFDKVVDVSKLLAQLLNAKVVLEKFEKPLIKSSRRLPLLDDEEDGALETNRKDYCHRYCDDCKKIVIDRIRDPIMKNCSDCKTAMTYLCIKCNVKHYKRYPFLKFHRARCNGNETSPAVDRIDDVDSSESNTEDASTVDAHERIDEIDQNESNTGDTSVADVHNDATSTLDAEGHFIVKQIDHANLSEEYNRYCSECDVVITSGDKRCNKCNVHLEFACKKCNAKYKFSSSMLYHMRSQCYPANEYQCTHCKYNTSDLPTMRKHIKNKHTKRRLLKCKLCSFNTTYHHNMKAHMKNNHHGKMIKRTDKVDQTEVNIEDRTCTAGGHMNSKLAIDKDEFVVKQTRTVKLMKGFDRYCSKCDVTMTKRHISRCNTCDTHLIYACRKCNAKYESSSSLWYHLKSQCYPTNDYQCTHCEYTTKTWLLMRQHFRNMHTDRPKFKCELCSYETKRKNILNQHIKKVHHKVDLKFQCKICEYSTSFRRHLRRHQERCH